MSQILLLKDKEGASADEFFQIMQRYAIDNDKSCDIKHVKQLSWRDIDLADIIFCIRGDTPYMFRWLELAKKMGKVIVYFLDDALKDIPNDSFRYPRRKKWHINCVKKCDVLLTTNPFIADDYREYIDSRRTAIINTAVDELIPYKLHEGPVKIVYAASEWHISNYKKMIAPIIQKLLLQNKGIEFYFVGFQPSGIEDERIHFVSKMNLKDYQSFMKAGAFDIGLAPLEKSYFSERKYFNKFIEYTRYGICGIYSDAYPYRFVVKNEKNGILVSDSPNNWLEGIQKLIDNLSLRTFCINNAQAFIKNEHCDAVIFEKLKADIPEIMYRRTEKRANTFKCGLIMTMNKLFMYYPFGIMEKMYMVKYSMKKEGIKKVINRIVRKINGGSAK